MLVLCCFDVDISSGGVCDVVGAIIIIIVLWLSSVRRQFHRGNNGSSWRPEQEAIINWKKTKMASLQMIRTASQHHRFCGEERNKIPSVPLPFWRQVCTFFLGLETFFQVILQHFNTGSKGYCLPFFGAPIVFELYFWWRDVLLFLASMLSPVSRST